MNTKGKNLNSITNLKNNERNCKTIDENAKHTKMNKIQKLIQFEKNKCNKMQEETTPERNRPTNERN